MSTIEEAREQARKVVLDAAWAQFMRMPSSNPSDYAHAVIKALETRGQAPALLDATEPPKPAEDEREALANVLLDGRDAEAGCPFCKLVMERVSTGRGIEQIGSSGVYHFEPLNPVTPGHRLFVPAFHYEDAAEAPSATGAVFEWAAWWAAQQDEDFNLIVNAGPAASQTVRHLHIHYVPRRPSDGLILPWSSLAEKRAELEAEQGETEWEYEATPDWIEGIRWSGTSLERHLSNLDRYSDPNGGWWYGEKENKPDRITYQARRRRKAGPWEPVPDTTNNESEGKA